MAEVPKDAKGNGFALPAKVKPGAEVYTVTENGKVAQVCGPFRVSSVTFHDGDATSYGIMDGGVNFSDEFAANKIFVERADAFKAASEMQEGMMANLWRQFAQANVQEKKEK